MDPATAKHQTPTHRFKLYVRTVIESEAKPILNKYKLAKVLTSHAKVVPVFIFHPVSTVSLLYGLADMTWVTSLHKILFIIKIKKMYTRSSHFIFPLTINVT